MKTRIITAIVLIIVILPCVIIGGLPFKILMGIIGGCAVFEMLSICDRPKANIYLYPLVGLFVFYTIFIEQGLLLSMAVVSAYLIILLVCSMFVRLRLLAFRVLQICF